MILLLIAQISNAQYDLALKGDKVKYDSAVVIEIKTYRQESLKLKTADSLINGFRQQLILKERENDKLTTIIENNDKYLLILKEANERKDKILEQTRKDCDNAINELSKTKWYNRKELWLAGGFIIASIIR